MALTPGTRPDEARKAFEMILGEMDKVRPANYRSPIFTRWKQIVGAAFVRFLGPEHLLTIGFTSLVFHGPMPKSPMDPPVSQKDIDAYAASMTRTEEMLTELIAALAPPPPEPAPAPATAAGAPARPVQSTLPGLFSPPAAEPADTGFRVTRGTAGEVSKFAAAAGPTPAAAAAAPASQDLSRHSGGIPAGGLKIVSRSGVSAPTNTMKAYIEACEDPEEKALLVQIDAIMDDPSCTWEHAKQLLAELWWLRRESVTRLLPIILRR